MKPYGVIADCHLHPWRSFSSVDRDGVNSRLQILLREIRRAAAAVHAAGGNTLVVAGDLFHVRGSVAPTVLNPTLDVFKMLVDDGMQIHMIPGNHDLEGKQAQRVSSSVTALESVGVKVYNQAEVVVLPDLPDLVMMPWIENHEELKRELETFAQSGRHLIAHAPVNGIIKGIPPNGLDPEYLRELDYDAMFFGHYHNHVQPIPERNLFSIGAIAAHTWSDVGTRAGFLLVSDDGVKYQASHAPSFVDVLPHMNEDDVAMMVDQNYVRVRTHSTKTAEIEKLREWLTDCGAKGVQIVHVPKSVEERDGSVAKAATGPGGSLEASISEFVQKSALFTEPERLEKLDRRCQAILAEAVAV